MREELCRAHEMGKTIVGGQNCVKEESFLPLVQYHNDVQLLIQDIRFQINLDLRLKSHKSMPF